MKGFDDYTLDDGKKLVTAARKIVTNLLNDTNVELSEELDDYSYESGVFVTLTNPNGLRGCIGYPMPDRKLSTALINAAKAAATEDPRFSPVQSKELEQICFEVSILTPPKDIKVDDPMDYPNQIKVGRDGLIVKYSGFSGLLLPQVPGEYGWSEKEFLEHTCEKAGLPKDTWQNKDTIIQKFEGIVFKEETPNGKIVREEL